MIFRQLAPSFLPLRRPVDAGFIELGELSMNRTSRPLSATLGTAVAASITATMLCLAAPAIATISDASLTALNPGPLASQIPAGQKKIACPSWSDCYEVTTRFIKVRIADPSEVSGDEIYALPMWGILDGMGIDPDPNADGTTDFFRVNITKSTWRPWDRGSNLGSQFYQRRTNTWIPLADRADSARHAKNFVFTDRIIPMSGKAFTPTEGLLFTNNFVEHDNSRESATDSIYLETARDFQGQLSRNSTLGRAKVRQAQYGLGDSLKAAATYVDAVAPDVAKVVSAATSNGATLLKKDGQPNVTNLITSTANLISSWMEIDGDDPGEQVTTFIPFSELAAPGKLGKEQTFLIRGKTDPNDITNSGVVEAVLGVKLVKVKNGSGNAPWMPVRTSTPAPATQTPAATARPSTTPSATVRPTSAPATAASTAAATGQLTVTGTARPAFAGALVAGQKYPITQGAFTAVNRTSAPATIMVVSSVVYCPAVNSGVNTCAMGAVINATAGTVVAPGTTVTLGGSSGDAGSVPANQGGKFAVLVSKAVNKDTQEILATSASPAVALPR